jgi:hypothetical protein
MITVVPYFVKRKSLLQERGRWGRKDDYGCPVLREAEKPASGEGEMGGSRLLSPLS